MPAHRPLGLAALAALALGLTASARAHEDPPGCGAAGIALTASLFRADERTGVVGVASECQHMFYRVTLRLAGPSGCAVSGGMLTLTTPDGVVHRLADEVAFGGTTGTSQVQSALVPYVIRARDVAAGAAKAVAQYEGGVVHDNPSDSRGIGAKVDRTVSVRTCADDDPCTVGRCDPTKAAVDACEQDPLCDDADPLTADVCAGGYCIFAPIASNDRSVCAGRPDTAEPFFVPIEEFTRAAARGHHAGTTMRTPSGRSRGHAHDHPH